MRRYHASASRNRESIRAHGLDWTRMSDVPGIAGSHRPEQRGIFLSDSEFDVDFFVRMAREPVDVWAVDGLSDDVELLPNGHGWFYYPGTIPVEQLVLLRESVAPTRERAQRDDVGYSSTLTIAFDDGRTLTGDEALEFVRAREADGTQLES